MLGQLTRHCHEHVPWRYHAGFMALSGTATAVLWRTHGYPSACDRRSGGMVVNAIAKQLSRCNGSTLVAVPMNGDRYNGAIATP